VAGDFVKSICNYEQTMLRVRDNKALPELLAQIGDVYNGAGFRDRANQFYQKRLALDGDSAIYYHNLGWTAFCAEDFQKALNFEEMSYKKDTTTLPNLILSRLVLYSMFLDQPKERYLYARKFIDGLKKTGEIPVDCSYRIGYALWKAGKQKEAKDFYDLQLKCSLESNRLGRFITLMKESYYDLAATYAFWGDKEKTYQYLDEFVKKHSFEACFIAYIKHDPHFNGIRQEPRFQKIIKEMEAKFLVEHKRVRKWMEEQKIL
jgi:tetratricopeptide (TPR) repeat protein